MNWAKMQKRRPRPEEGIGANHKARYTPAIQKIMKEKGGTAFPGIVNIRGDKGEILWSNKDIAWLAKSVFQNYKLKDSVDVSCRTCKKEDCRFVHQVFGTGWTCLGCGQTHEPLPEPIDEADMKRIIEINGYKITEKADWLK